jgi:ubiquitin carboxyl-terminal hydrolase L3
MSLWIPLESNPEVMNEFLTKIGVPDKLQICDIFGFEPELLGMVPKPVKAVLLCFPVSPQSEDFRTAQVTRVQELPPGVWFVTQTIGNACGTIGLLHAVGNNLDFLGPLNEGSWANKFFTDSLDFDAESRAALLQADDSIAEVHAEAAQQGQGAVPDRPEDCMLHFVCFVQKCGLLLELDGRKPFPINHGPCEADDLLAAAVRVIQSDFIETDPGSNLFSAVAYSVPPPAADLSGSALLQRVGDGNKVQQFAALLRDRLPGTSYRLLFTWSRDGRNAASFHQCCDNQVRARAFARAAAARLTAGAGAHARHRAFHHGPHVRRLRKRAVEQCRRLDQRCGMLPVPGRKSSRRRPHLL